MNFQSLFLNTIVDRIGMALVHFLWQGAAIAVVLAVALRILRHRSPQSRYLAAWTVLVAMTFCLPITAYYFPSAPRAEIAGHTALPNRDVARKPPVDRPVKTTNAESPGSGLEENVRDKNDTESAEFPDRAVVVSPRDAARNSSRVPLRQDSPANAGWSIAFLVRLLQPVLPWIVGVWLFGAMTLAVWHLGGFRHLVRLRRRGTGPAPAEIVRIMFRLSSRLGVRRSVSVLVSQMARVPTVLGWLRPVILLPASILDEMPTEQLEMILAHELAHIRRQDYLWNLLQIAVETVLFYHPAVWWVSRRIREERENCCDRQAVAAMGNPVVYAGALMRLAEIRYQLEQTAVPAASIAADGGSLESRIRRVLGLPVESGCNSNAWLGGVLAVLILAAVFSVNITWADAKPPDGNEPSSGKTTPPAAPVSMTAVAFGKLSNAEQRDLLVKAFGQHLEQGRNLFYETEQVYRAFDSDNWEPGKPTKRYDPYHRCLYRCWRLGDSYKTEMFQYDDPKQTDFHYSVDVENAQERIGRNVAIYKHGEENQTQGFVDYPRREPEIDERFPTFPSPDELVSCSGSQQYFFEYLMARKDTYEIKSPVSGDKVQLIVPRHGHKQVFLLDPQKGFLPIRFEARGDIPAAKGRERFWSEVRFEVQESRLVDNIWMPIKMRSRSLCSQGVLTISETKVSRTAVGSVTRGDLLLPFTKGMPVVDVIEGITYTADAQGNATGPVKDDLNWKHDPPEGWRKGMIEEAYSLASRIPAAEWKRFVKEREAKSKPIDEGLKVLRADPPAPQAERIEAALKILRVYDLREREGDWATAIRELIKIGKPAVPRLIEELDRTDRDRALRALGFVLRGIGDPRAVPGLIRAIPRLIQPASSDFGLTIKNDPELLKFMWANDLNHIGNNKGAVEMNGLIIFYYQRPIREIMTVLEKVTHQSLGWRDLDPASAKADGVIELRHQRTLFLDHARKWADWWSHNWKDFVLDERDAQLHQTQKSLDQFADTIAKMPLVNDETAAASSPKASSPNNEKTDSTSTIDQGEPTGHSNLPPAAPAEKAEPVPVSGRVLYHDGTPAAVASVFLVGDVSTTIGDGKAWHGIRSDNMEDKTITKTITDAAGRFTLPGGGDAKRIVVSAPRLDFWVVPVPENAAGKDSEFTIKLPAPGRLVVKYDIPGGDAKAKLFLQVNTWDSPLSRGIDDKPMPLVANKGQVVLDNLPPGKCILDREKNIAWGTYFCDRRLLTIESGKALESNFIRDRGTAVVGQVVGLKKEMRAAVSGAGDSAGVLVSVRSPEAKDGVLNDFELPLFDVLKCGLDGRFKTEQLLPGKYAIIVEAWLPEKPEGTLNRLGIQHSSFIGRAVVTVPESGQPLQVTVELKPRENTPPAKSGNDGKGSPNSTPKRS